MFVARPFFTGGGHVDHGWLIAAFVVNTVLWAALVGGLLWLGLSLSRGRRGRRGGPPFGSRLGPQWGPPQPLGRSLALDELDLRYARGEISRDEYLGRRADLVATVGSSGWGPPPWGSSPPAATPPSTPGTVAPPPAALPAEPASGC